MSATNESPAYLNQLADTLHALSPPGLGHLQSILVGRGAKDAAAALNATPAANPRKAVTVTGGGKGAPSPDDESGEDDGLAAAPTPTLRLRYGDDGSGAGRTGKASNDDADADADADGDEADEDGGGPPDTAQRMIVAVAIDGAESGTIYIGIAKVAELKWADGLSVTIWGRDGKSTVGTLVADESDAVEGHFVSMDEDVRRSLGVDPGDEVFVDQISVPPGAQSLGIGAEGGGSRDAAAARALSFDEIHQLEIDELQSKCEALRLLAPRLSSTQQTRATAAQSPNPRWQMRRKLLRHFGWGDNGNKKHDPKKQYGDVGLYLVAHESVRGTWKVKIGISEGQELDEGLTRRICDSHEGEVRYGNVETFRFTPSSRLHPGILRDVEAMIKIHGKPLRAKEGSSNEVFWFQTKAEANEFVRRCSGYLCTLAIKGVFEIPASAKDLDGRKISLDPKVDKEGVKHFSPERLLTEDAHKKREEARELGEEFEALVSNVNEDAPDYSSVVAFIKEHGKEGGVLSIDELNEAIAEAMRDGYEQSGKLAEEKIKGLYEQLGLPREPPSLPDDEEQKR